MSEDWSTMAVKLMTEAVDVLCFIMIQGLQIYFVFSVSYSKKFAIASILPHHCDPLWNFFLFEETVQGVIICLQLSK